jgi:hypothetical protein
MPLAARASIPTPRISKASTDAVHSRRFVMMRFPGCFDLGRARRARAAPILAATVFLQSVYPNKKAEE